MTTVEATLAASSGVGGARCGMLVIPVTPGSASVMPGNNRITVMCVDEHRLVRDGLALIINQQSDMEAIASAGSGEQAVDLYKRVRPDVTLMNLQLDGMTGVEAIHEIRRIDASAKIVAVAMLRGDDIYRAVADGAADYLLKDSTSEELVRVVRQVHAGERRILPDMEVRLAEWAANPTLTRRETQVIELISHGLRNKEIAASLGISEETVHVHVRNLLGKLKVNDRSGAISVAVRRGIIHIR